MRSKRSMRQNTSHRMRQKMTWKTYVAAGIALAMVIGVGVFLYLNLGNSQDTRAAGPTATTVYSVASGNWSDAASWEPRLPQSGDIIQIKSGHKISLMQSASYEGIAVAVHGTLWIDHAAKLNLLNGSSIEVFGPEGNIDGGKDTGQASNSKSTRIEYEGTSIWDSSMGMVTGYSTLNSEGYKNIGTLPVTLAYFKAEMKGNVVVAEWATEAESNNDFFTVERSTDAKNFQAVATIEGAGNSNSRLTYTFTDNAPLAGTSYYRLKQTDYDGKYEDFRPVTISNNSATPRQDPLTVLAVGPNPFDYTFFVNYNLAGDGPVEVRLMNMQGNVVLSQTIEGYAGTNRYDFNDGQGLATGTYFLSLIQNNTVTKAIRLIKK